MISIRHTGIYVRDIDEMGHFYQNVFRMKAICWMEQDANPLLDELLESKGSSILVTKLITAYGEKQKTGDMVELVKAVGKSKMPAYLSRAYEVGTAHIAFGVDDMMSVTEQIRLNGGRQETSIVRMQNQNLCCFCTDPEGNWIELIQRSE